MKTQTNFRKKALVSSIAMLLVAMVALGTATYAWFTNNPRANASGLKLKATSSNGLVIQTATHKAASADFWGHEDFLNYDTATGASKADSVQLNALSFDLSKGALGNTAFSAEAAADDNADADTTKAVTAVSSASGSSGGFYQEKVFAKLTGSAVSAAVNLEGLTVTFNDAASNIKNAVRIAVSYHDASGSGTDTLLGVYSISEQTGASYLKSTGATYSEATKDTFDMDAFNASLNKAAGTVHPTGNDYFEVTVYLDGEQRDCFTNNVNLNDIVNSVELKLVLA